MIAAYAGTSLGELMVDKQGLAVQVKEFRVLGIIIYLDIHLAAGCQAEDSGISGERMKISVVSPGKSWVSRPGMIRYCIPLVEEQPGTEVEFLFARIYVRIIEQRFCLSRGCC